MKPFLMQRRLNWEWWLLVTVLGLRLISMMLVPLSDTTEARYGDIARLMAISGDWITPWFSPGVPFWGKPPLSFWCEALSFDLFGVSEFAARFPSWLATVSTLVPIYALANAYYGRHAARRSLIVFSTCALPYLLSGVVLTDPFLVLGTTLSMAAFALAPKHPKPIWRYGFFVGLAIGLLAKGPVTLVLVGGALLPWLAWNHRRAKTYLCALPWARGSLLLGTLTLPWYIAAEIKTPGFLGYFIIGEHFLRYLDPGWTGDLYGTAHIHAYGSIWWYWFLTAVPWSIIGLGWLVLYLFHPNGRRRLTSAFAEPDATYLLAWSLFTLVFFSFASNLLWTYVLPALPAFSILLATKLNRRWPSPYVQTWQTPLVLALGMPLLILAAMGTALIYPSKLNTAKGLVHYVEQHAKPHGQLVYVHHRTFSARFYSGETAELVSVDHLPELLENDRGANLYFAVPKSIINEARNVAPVCLDSLFQNGRYILVTKPMATIPETNCGATQVAAQTGAHNG